MIRLAERRDLEPVVAIYNSAIPGGLATADTEPVSLESRIVWFEGHDPKRRPLWVQELDGAVAGWVSLQDFYGRPAYHATAEISVYVAPARQRRGVGRALLAHAIEEAPALGVATLLAFVFAHNAASLGLFEALGFARWGLLPRIAVLRGDERDTAILGLRLAP